MLSGLMLLIVIVILVSNHANTDEYIVGKNGNVVAIERSQSKRSDYYSLSLIVEEDGELVEREVSIKPFEDKKEKVGLKEKSKEDEKAAQREAEINQIISDIELSSEKKIVLPSKLSDGSSLNWRLRESSRAELSLVVISYIFALIMVAYTSQREEESKKSIIRAEILRALPRFCNQLLLSMSAGMILCDAFDDICTSYELIKPENRSKFQKDMIEMNSRNQDHRQSVAKQLSDYAYGYNVKELLRIATILSENEKRGSDVAESLSRESEFLWESRKITATERGKGIDVKMTLPLGLLLIMLIALTIAPAFLSM